MKVNNSGMDDNGVDLGLLPGLNSSSFENFMKEPVKKGDETKEDKDDKKNEKDQKSNFFVPPNEDFNDNLNEGNEENKDEENQSDQNENENSSDDPFFILGNFAKEIGILDFDEKEYKPDEGKDFLQKKFEETVDNRLKEIESSYPPEIQSLLANWREGVPLMDLIQSESRIQEIETIKPEDLEKIENQKEIVSMDLQMQDFTPEEIITKIEKYEEAGILKDEAKISLNRIVRSEKKRKELLIEESKKQAEENKRKAEMELEELKNSIMNKKSLFEGFSYSEKEKQKVFDAITKPVGKTPDGKMINLIGQAQLKDPDFWEKVAYMVVNNWDFSKFENKVKKEYTKEVKRTVNTFVDADTKKSKINIANIKAAIENIKRKQNNYL